MEKNKFIKYIVNEIKNLKDFSKPEQIENLNVESFSGFDDSNCIYGQMFGNCNNDQALEHKKKCALEFNTGLNLYSFSGIISAYCFYTPLECFLFNSYTSNEIGRKIIKYIKGEIDSLDDITESLKFKLLIEQHEDEVY